jgi:hypothetical protein
MNVLGKNVRQKYKKNDNKQLQIDN